MSEDIGFYNTEYICMYPYITDIITDPNLNKDDLEDLTYRKDLLNIFQLSSITDDEAAIQERLQQLYSFCKTNSLIHAVLNELVEIYHIRLQIPIESVETTDLLYLSFYVLFSFHFLHVAHPCFCDLITIGTISEIHQKNLYDTLATQKNENDI
jgi:hypothetical protein